MDKTIVISLGGSLIIPNKIDYNFLGNFKKAIIKNIKKHKFVIVCGGGAIAREYIEILKKQGRSKKEQAYAGIDATRMNAKILMKVFEKESNKTLPESIKSVKSHLDKNRIVICGALRYEKNETSDSTSAKLAGCLKTEFINLTDVLVLYTENPKTNPKAKFIPKISWKDFEKMAKKIPYTPGQHFVLDQHAAKIIKKHKIPTYIIGQNLRNFDRLLKNKKWTGTLIKS